MSDGRNADANAETLGDREEGGDVAPNADMPPPSINSREVDRPSHSHTHTHTASWSHKEYFKLGCAAALENHEEPSFSFHLMRVCDMLERAHVQFLDASTAPVQPRWPNNSRKGFIIQDFLELLYHDQVCATLAEQVITNIVNWNESGNDGERRRIEACLRFTQSAHQALKETAVLNTAFENLMFVDKVVQAIMSNDELVQRYGILVASLDCHNGLFVEQVVEAAADAVCQKFKALANDIVTSKHLSEKGFVCAPGSGRARPGSSLSSNDVRNGIGFAADFPAEAEEGEDHEREDSTQYELPAMSWKILDLLACCQVLRVISQYEEMLPNMMNHRVMDNICTLMQHPYRLIVHEVLEVLGSTLSHNRLAIAWVQHPNFMSSFALCHTPFLQPAFSHALSVVSRKSAAIDRLVQQQGGASESDSQAISAPLSVMVDSLGVLLAADGESSKQHAAVAICALLRYPLVASILFERHLPQQLTAQLLALASRDTLATMHQAEQMMRAMCLAIENSLIAQIAIIDRQLAAGCVEMGASASSSARVVVPPPVSRPIIMSHDSAIGMLTRHATLSGTDSAVSQTGTSSKLVAKFQSELVSGLVDQGCVRALVQIISLAGDGRGLAHAEDSHQAAMTALELMLHAPCARENLLESTVVVQSSLTVNAFELLVSMSGFTTWTTRVNGLPSLKLEPWVLLAPERLMSTICAACGIPIPAAKHITNWHVPHQLKNQRLDFAALDVAITHNIVEHCLSHVHFVAQPNRGLRPRLGLAAICLRLLLAIAASNAPICQNLQAMGISNVVAAVIRKPLSEWQDGGKHRALHLQCITLIGQELLGVLSIDRSQDSRHANQAVVSVPIHYGSSGAANQGQGSSNMQLNSPATGSALPNSGKSLNSLEISRMQKRSIANSTLIQYPQKELLQLIHDHLLSQGLSESAASLRSEAKLRPTIVINNDQLVQFNSSGFQPGAAPPSPKCRFLRGSARQIVQLRKMQTPGTASPVSFTKTKSTAYRADTKRLDSPSSFPGKNIMSKDQHGKLFSTSDAGAMIQGEQGQPVPSLDNIVVSYLRDQHRKCAEPMSICPPMSLLHPHKCPKQTPLQRTSPSLHRRLLERECKGHWGRAEGSAVVRRAVMSRHRKLCHGKLLLETPAGLTSCAMADILDSGGVRAMPILGDSAGDLIVYLEQDVSVYDSINAHATMVVSMDWLPPTAQSTGIASSGLDPNIANDRGLMLTSGLSDSAAWRVRNGDGDEGEYLEREPVWRLPDFVLGSWAPSGESVVGLWRQEAMIVDAETGITSSKLSFGSQSSSAVGVGVQSYQVCPEHLMNGGVAQFSHCERIVLAGGRIWDIRASSSGRQGPSLKLDRMGTSGGCVLHPWRPEAVYGAGIWDLRMTRGVVQWLPHLTNKYLKPGMWEAGCATTLAHEMHWVGGMDLAGQIEDPSTYGNGGFVIDWASYSIIAETPKSAHAKRVAGTMHDRHGRVFGVIEAFDGDYYTNHSNRGRLFEVGLDSPDDNDTNSSSDSDDDTLGSVADHDGGFADEDALSDDGNGSIAGESDSMLGSDDDSNLELMVGDVGGGSSDDFDEIMFDENGNPVAMDTGGTSSDGEWWDATDDSGEQ